MAQASNHEHRTHIVHVQRTISAMFDRLSYDGMASLDAAAVRQSLHPGEWCSLQEGGLADIIDPGGSRLSAAECSRARQSAGPDKQDQYGGDDLDMAIDEGEVKAVRPCWMLTPRAVAAKTPRCTISPENYALHRHTMFSRFSRIAAGTASSSHLRSGPLMHGQSMLFYGDSLIWDLFQAARCETMRSSDSARSVKLLEYISIYAPNRLKLRKGKGVNLHALVLNATLNRFSSRGGGMVVASLGHHFNNFYAPPKGFVEAFDVGIRPQYHDQLQKLAGVLEEYVQRGPGHTAMLITPAVQHFATWDGAFAPSIRNATGYGCRQAPRAHELSNSTSPNFWRSGDMLRIARERAPHVLLVPQHVLSHYWWDQHPGASAFAKVSVKGAVAKSTTDCTHFCYGPYIYEPIWWAIRQLSEAANQSSPSEKVMAKSSPIRDE